MFAVVDMFDGGYGIRYRDELRYRSRAILEEIRKFRGIGEEKRFVFMQLEVWDEAMIADVRFPGLLQSQDVGSRIGWVSRVRAFTWKIIWQGVQIEHGREEGVSTASAPDRIDNVFSNAAVFSDAVNVVMFPFSRGKSMYDSIAAWKQVFLKHPFAETLLSLPLAKHIQLSGFMFHGIGPPPTKTLRCQSSPTE